MGCISLPFTLYAGFTVKPKHVARSKIDAYVVVVGGLYSPFNCSCYHKGILLTNKKKYVSTREQRVEGEVSAALQLQQHKQLKIHKVCCVHFTFQASRLLTASYSKTITLRILCKNLLH